MKIINSDELVNIIVCFVLLCIGILLLIGGYCLFIQCTNDIKIQNKNNANQVQIIKVNNENLTG